MTTSMTTTSLQRTKDMLVSTKGRYALRIMLALAKRSDEGYIPLKELAKQEQISQKYLESIMTVLSKGELVDATHGKNGGYRLNRPLEAYTVESILNLTEGGLTTVGCGGACDRSEQCLTRPMWRGLDELVHSYFRGITLASLLENGV